MNEIERLEERIKIHLEWHNALEKDFHKLLTYLKLELIDIPTKRVITKVKMAPSASS